MMALPQVPLEPHIMASLQMLENPEEVDEPHMIALPERPEEPHIIALPPTNCVLPQTAGPDQACDDPHTAEAPLVRVTLPVFEL